MTLSQRVQINIQIEGVYLTYRHLGFSQGRTKFEGHGCLVLSVVCRCMANYVTWIASEIWGFSIFKVVSSNQIQFCNHSSFFTNADATAKAEAVTLCQAFSTSFHPNCLV